MYRGALLSTGPDAHDDASTTLTPAFQQHCSSFGLIRLKEDHPECCDDSAFMVFFVHELNIFLGGYLEVDRDSENALFCCVSNRFSNARQKWNVQVFLVQTFVTEYFVL